MLERKFEHAWCNVMHTSTLEESFDQLWNTDPGLAPPILFFNSTEAASAERVVFTNISMAGVPGLNAKIEAVAQSLPLRLSTAMLLSARDSRISARRDSRDRRKSTAR
jgi:hypothetical protein